MVTTDIIYLVLVQMHRGGRSMVASVVYLPWPLTCDANAVRWPGSQQGGHVSPATEVEVSS